MHSGGWVGMGAGLFLHALPDLWVHRGETRPKQRIRVRNGTVDVCGSVYVEFGDAT